MSLDALFQPVSKGANDSADLLVIGFEDGTVHLSIYDFFEIGHFSLPTDTRPAQHTRLVSHCFHPYSTTHPLLVAKSTPDGQTLCMTPLDLRLISSTGRYLSLLASKSTRLHNLLRYMQQVQKQIYSELKASQDLPRRFVRNVEETLQETHDCTWTQAAYHTVVTGHCFPQVKEWLVEEMGERVRTSYLLRSAKATNYYDRDINDGKKQLVRDMRQSGALRTRIFYRPWKDLRSL